VFLALTVPITTLSPVAGLLLDRLPTRPVLVTAAAVEAAVALGLAAASGVPATLALAFGFGVCAAILQPGLGAVVPRLAGGTAIARANSYLQAATWAGFPVGPLLAGLLISTAGSGAAFLADAALYALGAAGLWALRLAPNADGVPARWITFPGADAGRVLLYLHGGGYQIGPFRSHAELAARLGRASGRRVLLPEYRLAPEHPFPAAIDDVLAVWRWLRDAVGLDASAVAVAGDSAGGALAVAMMTTLRDTSEDLPTAAVLMSPWTDLSSSGASMTERAGEDRSSPQRRSGRSPPPTWPAPIPARRWRRRCSHGRTACRRC
jgi:MFS family permease